MCLCMHACMCGSIQLFTYSDADAACRCYVTDSCRAAAAAASLRRGSARHVSRFAVLFHRAEIMHALAAEGTAVSNGP